MPESSTRVNSSGEKLFLLPALVLCVLHQQIRRVFFRGIVFEVLLAHTEIASEACGTKGMLNLILRSQTKEIYSSSARQHQTKTELHYYTSREKVIVCRVCHRRSRRKESLATTAASCLHHVPTERWLLATSNSLQWTLHMCTRRTGRVCMYVHGSGGQRARCLGKQQELRHQPLRLHGGICAKQSPAHRIEVQEASCGSKGRQRATHDAEHGIERGTSSGSALRSGPA